MELLSENKPLTEKNFTNSEIVIKNRSLINLTGVERIYESNETKIQLKVSGTNLQICGDKLNISKIDVEEGILSLEGIITELKYFEKPEKKNFFKKMFK